MGQQVRRDRPANLTCTAFPICRHRCPNEFGETEPRRESLGWVASRLGQTHRMSSLGHRAGIPGAPRPWRRLSTDSGANFRRGNVRTPRLTMPGGVALRPPLILTHNVADELSVVGLLPGRLTGVNPPRASVEPTSGLRPARGRHLPRRTCQSHRVNWTRGAYGRMNSIAITVGGSRPLISEAPLASPQQMDP
jgi:hypothetical protein